MNLGRILRIVIPFLLFVVAAIYLFRLVPDIELNLFSLLTFENWLLVIAVFLIVQALNILYFKLILTKMCNFSSLTRLLEILFASYSFNYAGPLKLGIPVRVFLFKRILGIPYAAGIATVVATTGLDVFILITLVFVTGAWTYISPFAGIIVGLTMVAVLVNFAAVSHKPLDKLAKRATWLARFLTDIGSLSPFVVLCAIFISATKFLLISFCSWFVLKALGAATGLAELSLVYFSSHLAGLLSFIPMGIGVKDASVIELLAHMNTYPSIGIAFVAIDRLIWSLIPLLIGFGAGWHLGIREIIASVTSDNEHSLWKREK